MWFLILIFLAPVSLGLAAWSAWWLWRGERAWTDPHKWILAISLAAYCGVSLFLSLDILDDPSSTAVLGLYVVPAVAWVLACILALVLAALAVVFLRWKPMGRGVEVGVFTGFRRVELLVAFCLLLIFGIAGTWSCIRALEIRRASDPEASLEQLRQEYLRASGTGDAWTLSALAKNPRTPTDVVLDLAAESGPAVTRAPAIIGPIRWGPSALWHLVQRPEIPEEALRRLARSEDELLVARVAGHPRAPEEVLRQLGEHPSIVVLRALAYNPRTPSEVLEALKDHPDEWVRRGVERTLARE